MNNMVDREWLASLKVGDEVAVKEVYMSSTSYTITVVTKITPKRRTIDVVGHSGFNDGKQGGGFSTRRFLVPVTEEIQNWISRQTLLNKIEHFPFKVLKTEQLQEIQAILDKSNVSVEV